MNPHTHVKITLYTQCHSLVRHYNKCHNLFPIPHNDLGCIHYMIRNPTGSCGPICKDTLLPNSVLVQSHRSHWPHLLIWRILPVLTLFPSWLGGSQCCLMSTQMPLAFTLTYTFPPRCVAYSLFSSRAWSTKSMLLASNFHLCRERLIPFFVGTLLSFWISHSLMSMRISSFHSVAFTNLWDFTLPFWVITRSGRRNVMNHIAPRGPYLVVGMRGMFLAWVILRREGRHDHIWISNLCDVSSGVGLCPYMA